MGIGDGGFDYCRVEDILERVGPRLSVPHRHDYYEIIWFTGCSGRHMVEFTTYEFGPDTLFFFPRNQIHAFITTENHTGHMLRFDESFIRDASGSGLQEIANSLFKVHASPMRPLTVEHRATFRGLFSLLQAEGALQAPRHHADMLQTVVRGIMIAAERLLPSPDRADTPDRQTVRRFQRFLDLLEQHFCAHYTVERYARTMRLSPKALQTVCKQVSGLSAKNIITERVILEAQFFLRNTDLDVQQIAYRLGYEDPSYFSRLFKSRTHLSPSGFRTQDNPVSDMGPAR